MGDWALGEKLGEGQFAKVFKCRRQGRGRGRGQRDGQEEEEEYALKVWVSTWPLPCFFCGKGHTGQAKARQANHPAFFLAFLLHTTR